MGLSQREYARHRGVRLSAVQKAIKRGRITLGADGKIDPAEADREWEENTDQGQQRGERNGHGRKAFADANTERMAYKAKLARLEYEEKAGQLVPVAAVRAKLLPAITDARTKLLGITSKLRTRLQHLTAEDLKTIDALVRESLDDVAAGVAKWRAKASKN